MKSEIQMRVTNLLAEGYARLPRSLQKLLVAVRQVPRHRRWRADPLGQGHAREILGPLKGAFRGARCVVIGNGPSLRKTEMGLLRNEVTFGLNRIYLMYPELGWTPHFHCCTNRFVLEQFGEEILAGPGLKLVNWRFHRLQRAREDVVALCQRPSWTQVTLNPMEGYGGRTSTVTLLAVDLALFLGFEEIVLVGVDHSFDDKGTGNRAVVSSGRDPNHFHPDYFGKDVIWQLPDLDEMEAGYREARQKAEMIGAEIIDATVDGRLTVFRKVGLAETLKNSTRSSLQDLSALQRAALPSRG